MLGVVGAQVVAAGGHHVVLPRTGVLGRLVEPARYFGRDDDILARRQDQQTAWVAA